MSNSNDSSCHDGVDSECCSIPFWGIDSPIGASVSDTGGIHAIFRLLGCLFCLGGSCSLKVLDRNAILLRY